MNKALLLVSSFTEAKKGQSLLSGFNIKCRIEKLSSVQGGCTYGIRVFKDPEKASRLLGTININVIKIVGSADP